ncbi:hypothetical protein BKA64DRAFT_719033 [Cadophora sp. MPI-SDFR-AT-0126]|nr:hypothetical protein BKA64DRAFT_719033 [Leotiomycetes sp. MPI-SDFR-AT-0126]
MASESSDTAHSVKRSSGVPGSSLPFLSLSSTWWPVFVINIFLFYKRLIRIEQSPPFPRSMQPSNRLFLQVVHFVDFIGSLQKSVRFFLNSGPASLAGEIGRRVKSGQPSRVAELPILLVVMLPFVFVLALAVWFLVPASILVRILETRSSIRHCVKILLLMIVFVFHVGQILFLVEILSSLARHFAIEPHTAELVSLIREDIQEVTDKEGLDAGLRKGAWYERVIMMAGQDLEKLLDGVATEGGLENNQGDKCAEVTSAEKDLEKGGVV